MAGAGFRTFVDGDILTAAQVNTYLMEQSVMVFASAAARTSAIAAPSEGMVTYLSNNDLIEYYDGAAWQPLLDQDVIAAKGDLIVGTGDDTVDRLAVGTNGHVLTADSSTATGLKWAAAAGGGGKVLQVVQATTSTPVTIASTSLTDTGLSATITPTLATSKILVYANHIALASRGASAIYAGLELLRGATSIWDDGTNNQRSLAAAGTGWTTASVAVPMTCIYLDSPNTTSATTYKTQSKVHDTSSSGQIVMQSDNGISVMILMEIGA